MRRGRGVGKISQGGGFLRVTPVCIYIYINIFFVEYCMCILHMCANVQELSIHVNKSFDEQTRKQQMIKIGTWIGKTIIIIPIWIEIWRHEAWIYNSQWTEKKGIHLCWIFVWSTSFQEHCHPIQGWHAVHQTKYSVILNENVGKRCANLHILV